MLTCRVRHAVVVRAGHCLGVIDDRALVEAWHERSSALRATPVSKLLRDHTCCVLPETPLQKAAAIMYRSGVDAVPVVEADGALIGLLTAGDVVHAVARHGLNGALHLFARGARR